MKNLRLTYLLLGLAIMFTACGESGTAKGDDKSSDDTEVVKVEPQEQDFPVNKIPDDEFGKAAEWEEGEVTVPTAPNLTVSEEKFPEWLDAIVSRESIVLFAQKVLADMPEEVEFVQSGQQHLIGPDNWRAFYVHFNTRPSNAHLVIYGGYQSESACYWASHYTRNGTSIEWTNAAPSESGVLLIGKGSYDGEENNYNFSADIGKKAVALKRSPAGA